MLLVEKMPRTVTINDVRICFLGVQCCRGLRAKLFGSTWNNMQPSAPKCCGHFVMAFANKTDACVFVDST